MLSRFSKDKSRRQVASVSPSAREQTTGDGDSQQTTTMPANDQRKVEHNCVESLQKLVQVQHDKISNLETELRKLAEFFGEREQLLVTQISALHGEIQRQNVTVHHLSVEKVFQVPGGQVRSIRVRKCENGNWGFTFAPLKQDSDDPSSAEDGVYISEMAEDNSGEAGLKVGDWILRVNGRDVSRSRHEEAVEAFRTAQEPIVVEVLRRSAPPTKVAPVPSPEAPLCDTSTQTEWTGGWETPPLNALGSLTTNGVLQTSPFHQMALLHGSDVINPFEQDDDDVGCEIEYEEVILHRSSSTEKLGLTLCYGAPDDPDTDIYVSEIEPSSVAAQDGRIQEGDQLLQINGVDVRNREQAVSLFAESRTDFALLVARPSQVEEYLLEETNEETNGLCRTHNVLLEADEDEATDCGTGVHEKDSGVGRTDESTRNDESSEPEGERGVGGGASSSKEDGGSVSSADAISPQECDKFREQLELKCASTSTTNLHSELLPGSREDILPPLPPQRPLPPHLNPQQQIHARFQSDASLDREMARLNQEMENIQLECESLVNRHMLEQERIKRINDHVYVNLAEWQPNGKVCPDPRSAPPLTKKETVERWVKSMVFGRGRMSNSSSSGAGGLPTTEKVIEDTSSSAYNTGGSSRSTPLTLELSPLVVGLDKKGSGSLMSLVTPQMEDKGTQLQESDVASIFSCDSCRRCCKSLLQSDSESCRRRPDSRVRRAPRSLQGESVTKRTEEKNKNYVTFHPCTTMYTNQANLQHTIWLQQQLFRDALAQAQQQAAKRRQLLVSRVRREPGRPVTVSCPSSPSRTVLLDPLREDEEIKMEWKVKRRADGTRYITHRPVRNRILKERALKITEERSGLTTDDDAVSELKVGRYWSKEERKRHLERARDRKRKEMLVRSKMASVREQGGEPGKTDDTKGREPSILELSQKKLLKKKGKSVFDDFTTVQEVLAHGNKGQGSKTLGLLSVTTV